MNHDEEKVRKLRQRMKTAVYRASCCEVRLKKSMKEWMQATDRANRLRNELNRIPKPNDT